MKPRERIQEILNGNLPDRVPNALGGCETVGMHVINYPKLQRVLGIKQTPPRIDTFMTNAVFELDVINAMQGDVVLAASPRMCRSPLRGENIEKEWKLQRLWDADFLVSQKESFLTLDDGSMVWETAGGAVCPKGAYFFDSSAPSDFFKEFELVTPDDYNPSPIISDEVLNQLERTARTLYEESDLSVCMGETITDLQYTPGGMIGGMIYMLEHPEWMEEILQKSVDAALSQLKLLDQAVGRYVDILSIAHDLGDNRGVTIGAPLWRKLYKPYYTKLFQGWKKITSMKINLHSCGAISEVLGDLIECGVDIYNPVQISADGMKKDSLKQRFGDKLIFWGGGFDAQQTPVSSNYETVYRQVADNINTLKQGGRYLFAGVHNLPPEMPETHIRAMLDAYYDNRQY